MLSALFLAAQTAIEIESLYKGINFMSVLICARFEELCGDLSNMLEPRPPPRVYPK
jgi:hypothetical protein